MEIKTGAAVGAAAGRAGEGPAEEAGGGGINALEISANVISSAAATAGGLGVDHECLRVCFTPRRGDLPSTVTRNAADALSSARRSGAMSGVIVERSDPLSALQRIMTSPPSWSSSWRALARLRGRRAVDTYEEIPDTLTLTSNSMRETENDASIYNSYHNCHPNNHNSNRATNSYDNTCPYHLRRCVSDDLDYMNKQQYFQTSYSHS